MVSRRSCSRGIRFRLSVWQRLSELGVSVNDFVNRACEELIASKLSGEVLERFKVEAEMDSLREDERDLRSDLRLILRNGAYLPDYASKLLEGDRAQVSLIRRRRAVYSQVEPEELDVILRILARREAIAKRLVELKAQTLPKDRYPFGLTERGFRTRARAKRKLNREAEERQRHEGGET